MNHDILFSIHIANPFLYHLSLSLSYPISLSPSLCPFFSPISLCVFCFIFFTNSLSPSLFVGIEPATTDVKSQVHTTTPPNPPSYQYSKHYIISFILNNKIHDLLQYLCLTIYHMIYHITYTKRYIT